MHKFINNDLKYLLWLPVVTSSLLFGYGTALLAILCLNCSEALMRRHATDFVLFAISVTIILAGVLLLAAWRYKSYRKQLLRRVILLLLNIPIGFIYLFIYLKLSFPDKP